MAKRILIIDGHLDQSAERYVHALSKAYFDGAKMAGHEVGSIIVSELEFPLLRTSVDFQVRTPPDSIVRCQQDLLWADHVDILFQLWLGSMPSRFYRWYFRAHSLKTLQRNILRFFGFSPVRASVVGMVESMSQAGRGEWLARIQELGRCGL